MNGFLEYVPGDSLLHRLNPVAKLAFAVLFAGAFLVMSLLTAVLDLIFRMPVLECSLEEMNSLLQQHGLPLYGAALSDSAKDLRTVSLDRAAVAIGSEGQGLSRELLSACDGEIIIPMRPESESLNAAIAASVVMWEMARTGECGK